MVDPFIARRRGQEEPSYIHPKLEKILEKTYGVVLYQEQVIEIASEIAGFTPGESDRLRKAMTHFRSQQEMEDIGKEFIHKAVVHGVEQEVAETIFSYIIGYAGYGFTKPMPQPCRYGLPHRLSAAASSSPVLCCLIESTANGILSS